MNIYIIFFISTFFIFFFGATTLTIVSIALNAIYIVDVKTN